MLLTAVVLLGYGGYWLDQRYGTSPWLLIVGVLLGIATAFQSLFRQLRNLEAAKKKEKEKERSGAENDRRARPRQGD